MRGNGDRGSNLGNGGSCLIESGMPMLSKRTLNNKNDQSIKKNGIGEREHTIRCS